MKLIEILHSNCVGCRLCEMICSLFHEGECSTTRSRITIFRDEEFGKTGAVLVDDKLCNGCNACLAACPLGGLSLDKEKDIVFKCDLCGGDPQCVQFCSREALAFKDTDIDSPERKSFMTETGKLLSQV